MEENRMNIAERISGSIELVENYKQNLRKSIFSVLLEWKGFDEQIASARKCFQECFSEIESREKHLNLVEESLSQSIEQLDLTRISVENRLQEVLDKEKELMLFYDNGSLKLGQKREDCLKEVQFGEAKLNVEEKHVKELLGKMEVGKAEIEGMNKAFEERLDMELKEKSFEEKRKDFELIESSIERRLVEIDQREGKVQEREKKAGLKEKEMDLMMERQREVEMKAKELELLSEDLVLKEKDLKLSRELNENRVKELDMWEKQLDTKMKQLDTKEKQMDLTKKEKDQLEKELFEKYEELDLMKKKLEDGIREVEVKLKDNELKELEIQLNREQNEKRAKELDMREKQLDSVKKNNEAQLEKVLLEKHEEMDLMKKKLEDRVRELEAELKDKELRETEIQSKREKYEKCAEELGMREKQLDSVKKDKETQLEKELLEKSKELDLLKRKLNDKLKEVESKEKELELKEKQSHRNSHKENLNDKPKEKESHLGKELQKKQLNVGHRASVKEEAVEESREEQPRKKFNEENCNSNHLKRKESHLEKELQKKQPNAGHHASVKEEACEELVDMSLSPNSSSASKGIREEGRDLQNFLKEHEKDLVSVGDQVLKVLQLSEDPAKLVLIAIDGIYPSNVRKGKEEFKESDIRSCILLLEQLTKIPVENLPSVKDEALKLATEWKAKMTIRNPLEVLGFLYFLASYGLDFAFSEEVLMRFLEVVVHHHQTAELCRHLGLKNRIPDLIRELIRKNQLLLAFDYVYEFKLVDIFPPVAILKRHIKFSSMEAKKILKRGNMTSGAQDQALFVEICALKDVIKCIMRRSLHSEYPPDELRARIELLEKQREALKRSTHAPSSKENLKFDSSRSDLMQHDEIKQRQSPKADFRQEKRRNSDRDVRIKYESLSPPPRKCRRWVSPDAPQSGQPSSQHPDDGFHTDPCAPSLIAPGHQSPRHSRPDVNHLVRKYLSAGNSESLLSYYPSFHYEVDSNDLRPPSWHSYDPPNVRLMH